MIYQVLFAFLALEAVVAFWRPQYAIGICLLVISLFPPALSFNVGINLNSFNLSVLIIILALLGFNKKKECFYPNLPRIIRLYIIYVAISSLVCAVLNDISLSEYIQNMILLLLEYGAVAYAMCWIQMNNKEIKVMNFILLVVTFIVVLYGFVNYVLKFNPYISYISTITDKEIDYSNILIEEQRGILDGRASSVFIHPLILGQWILLVFSYFFYELKERWHFVIYSLFLILLFICEFLTGSRSSLLPIIMVPFIYLLHQNPAKIIRYLLVSIFVFIMAYPLMPSKLQDYTEATVFFWDDKAVYKAEINGSTKEGRIGQIEEAFSAVQDNPILGKGFNFIARHREELPSGIGGSESIFLSHLINGGILGILIFLFFYFRLYKYLRKKCHTKDDKALVDSLCVPFFVSICLTGISYSFFCVFLIFYMISLYKVTTPPSHCEISD